MTGAVSVAAGLVCIVAAVLMWTIGGRHTPRLVVLLVLSGVTGILGTWAGRKLNQGVTFLDSAVASVSGQMTGVVVTGLLGAGLLYVLAIDMWQKRVSTRTLLVAAALPVTVVAIPGAFGSMAAGLVGGVAGAVGKGVSAAFGIG